LAFGGWCAFSALLTNESGVARLKGSEYRRDQQPGSFRALLILQIALAAAALLTAVIHILRLVRISN
jgi:hypothetical protein